MVSYVLYARKSTESEDRQVLSIEAQIKEVIDYARRNDLTVTRTYLESRSAKKPGRPVFNQMIKELRRQKTAGILCWKLDRLTRNLLDAALISELLESGAISEIRTPSQVYRNTASDKFMTGLDFIMAKKYIDDLSENVRRGIRARVERGWFPGRPPVGYLNYRDPVSGQAKVIVDETRFTALRKVWEYMLSGNYPVARILDMANNDWGFRMPSGKHSAEKPLSRSGIYSMFQEPFYWGQIRFKGELYQGKHQPLVTAAEFERVQELLGRKGRERPKRHAFAFTGIIRCGGCGGMVTAEVHNKQIKATGLWKRFVYYRCGRRKDPSCKEPPISEEDLKGQIGAMLSKLSIPQAYLEWIFKYLDGVKQDETKKADSLKISAQREIENIEQRLSNLLALKISPANAAGELLSDAEFKEQKYRLVGAKARLAEKLEGRREAEGKVAELTREAFNFAAYAGAWFRHGPPERQREILSAVGLNHTLKTKKLIIELKKPLSMLENSALRAGPENNGFEPPVSGQPCEKSGPFEPAFLAHSGVVDDVRTEIAKVLSDPQGNENSISFPKLAPYPNSIPCQCPAQMGGEGAVKGN